MRRLQMRCGGCGEVSLRANDIVVSGTDDPSQVLYWFRCPGCSADVEQHCDAGTGRLLLMSGAQLKPAAVRVAPPLTLGDLVPLRELLDRPDFVEIMGKAG